MATSASHTPISRVPADLEPLIQKERTRCTSLGHQLKIPLSVLQDLEKKSKVKKPNRECFHEMWQQWFNDKEDRKWIEIFEALKQQRHNSLKNTLEKKYKPDTPVQEDFNFEGELKEMIPKWYQFGRALGVSTTDMNIIKEDAGGSEVYMISMLEEWKNTHEDSYTWETLQKALRVIGNNTLATNLEEHRLKDKQDSAMTVPSNSKAQVDGDGSSSEKYGCKLFYQRRDVNTWKITFAIFPCDKSDVVKCNEDEQEGPSCHFDLETDTVEIDPKEQAGWSSNVTRKEVTKASVDAYTGAGKAPFCEMTVTAASSQSTPPPLAMDVELEGQRPTITMQLQRKAENVPIQALEEHELQTDHDLQHAIKDPRTHWNLRDCKYEGDGTTLMVFDTGIDMSHPSFSSRSKELLLLPQKAGSYDDANENGHGTLCAGVACGAELKGTFKDGKSFKCCGVAPNAKLGIWKAYNKDERTEWKRQLKLLTEYIEKYEEPPIDVLVIASGGPDPDPDMQKHIKTLDDKGIIIVCSGSNDGAESNSIAYPACFPQTICIGSNTPGSRPSDFSPEGEEMEFLCIGENIIGPKSKKSKRKSDCFSEESSKKFVICKGTSFSAPAVGGLICLILETLKSNQGVLRIAEKLNREFIVKLLKCLTNKKGLPRNESCGYGAIDRKRLRTFFDDPEFFIKGMRYDNKIMPLAPIS